MFVANYMKGMAMIGLSLSFCIHDILEGKAVLADVEYIVAGTCAGNPELFREALAGYAERYWRKDPQKGVRVAIELYQAGKVHQPRLENHRHYPVLPNKAHWVDSESEIVWSDSDAFEQGT